MMKKLGLGVSIVLVIAVIFTCMIKKTKKEVKVQMEEHKNGVAYTIKSTMSDKENWGIVDHQTEMIARGEVIDKKTFKKWEQSHPHYRRKVIKKGRFTFYTYVNTLVDASKHQPWIYVYIVNTKKAPRQASYVNMFCESFVMGSAQANAFVSNRADDVIRVNANSLKMRRGDYALTIRIGLLSPSAYKDYRKTYKNNQNHEYKNITDQQKITIRLSKVKTLK